MLIIFSRVSFQIVHWVTVKELSNAEKNSNAFLFTSIRLFMKGAALTMHTDKYFSNKWDKTVHFNYLRDNPYGIRKSNSLLLPQN